MFFSLLILAEIGKFFRNFLLFSTFGYSLKFQGMPSYIFWRHANYFSPCAALNTLFDTKIIISKKFVSSGMKDEALLIHPTDKQL